MANPTKMQPETADAGLEKLKNTANLEQTKQKLSGQQAKPQQNSIDEVLKSPESRLKMDLLNAVAVINYLNKANLASMKTQSVSAVAGIASKAKSAYERFCEIFNRRVPSSGKKLAEDEERRSKDLAFLKASKEIADKIMELNKRIVALNEKKAKFANEKYQEFLKKVPSCRTMSEKEFHKALFRLLNALDMIRKNANDDAHISSASLVELFFNVKDPNPAIKAVIKEGESEKNIIKEGEAKIVIKEGDSEKNIVKEGEAEDNEFEEFLSFVDEQRTDSNLIHYENEISREESDINEKAEKLAEESNTHITALKKYLTETAKDVAKLMQTAKTKQDNTTNTTAPQLKPTGMK